MTANKLKIKNLGKLEPGGVYAIKFNRLMSMDEITKSREIFENLYRDHGYSFIIFDKDMEILNPQDLKEILVAVLKTWGDDLKRVVTI